MDTAMPILASLTDAQLALVRQEILQSGPSLLDKVRDYRVRRTIGVPLMSVFDSPALDDSDTIALLIAAKLVLNDALAAQWDADKYALVLTRATGCPSDLAMDIARNQVVTTDSDMRSVVWTLLNTIPDIPIFPGDDIARSLVSAGAAGLNFLYGTLSSRNFSKDVLYEWLRLGRAAIEMKKRATLVLMEASAEAQYQAPGTNPSGALGATATSAAGLGLEAMAGLLPVLIAAATSMLAAGDALTPKVEGARESYKRMSHLARTQVTPYHRYAVHHPEMGDTMSDVTGGLHDVMGFMQHDPIGQAIDTTVKAIPVVGGIYSAVETALAGLDHLFNPLSDQPFYAAMSAWSSPTGAKPGHDATKKAVMAALQATFGTPAAALSWVQGHPGQLIPTDAQSAAAFPGIMVHHPDAPAPPPQSHVSAPTRALPSTTLAPSRSAGTVVLKSLVDALRTGTLRVQGGSFNQEDLMRLLNAASS